MAKTKGALIGRINVDLVANVGKLLAPLKKAEHAVRSLASKVTAPFRAIPARLIATATGFLSMALAISKVKQAFDDLDTLAKQADFLGTTTEELIKLEHAAKMSSMSSEDLVAGLKAMLRAGYEVRDIDEIADRLLNITDASKRMQVASEIFGKSGAKMIGMLSRGSAGLAKDRKEAELLGLTLSRMDAAQIEEANSAMDMMREAVTAVARQFAVQLAPWVKWVAGGMVKMLKDFGGAAPLATTAINGIIDAIGALADAIQSIGYYWHKAQGWTFDFAANAIIALNALKVNIPLLFQETSNAVRFQYIEWSHGLRTSLADLFEWLGMTGVSEWRKRSEQKYLDELMEPYRKIDWVDDKKAYEFAEQFRKQLEAEAINMTATADKWDPGEKWSAQIRRSLAGMRGEFEEGPWSALEDMELDGKKLADLPAALERGSQAAMSAILSTTKRPIEEKALEESKKHTVLLKKIEEDRIIMMAAGLT